MLRAVASYLLAQAKEAADAVASHDVVPGSIRLATVLHDFWGNGSFRKALAGIPEPRPRLGEFARYIQAVDPDAPFASETLLRAVDTDDDSLRIDYLPQGAAEWRPLLSIVPNDDMGRSRIARGLPRTAADLGGTGDMLADRVVTSPLRNVVGAEWGVLAAWMKHDASLAEYFVASGRRIVDHLGIADAYAGDKHADLISLDSTRRRCFSASDLLDLAKERLRTERPQVV